MKVSVKFLGGAGTVTGSKYLISAGSFSFLIDCGLFQGLKEYRLRNWHTLPVDIRSIQAVILTHAHIDHIGYLPRLVKDGFNGPVYCTRATADLAEIMLPDSARLQEEEAAFAKKEGYSRHAEPQPLYTEEDAYRTLPLLQPYRYQQRFAIHDNVEVVFSDAGHLLGSAIIEIFIRGNKQHKKLVFSGDLGRYNQEILYDPTAITHTDILFVESTYANRENDVSNLDATLAKIINQTFSEGGLVLVPAFAVGRTQAFLYHLRQLMQKREIPEVPVYIDSPLAISASALYARHTDCHKMHFDVNTLKQLIETRDVVFCRTKEQSKQLNNLKSHAIIISASGMMTGGRILHHLYNRLPRQQDTLLIIGYQAEGTRGRRLLDGEKSIRIFGQEVPVRCRLEYISGLSGHADRSELLRWLSHFRNKPKYTFTIHGEPDSLQALASELRNQFKWKVIIPHYLENVPLFDAI
ncbi:MAG: MBL fold hydrolase [Chitinophagales bacterium]|nr:MAG: MBL fold hydrolase [Chitinophagales bacterium]